MKLYFNKNDFTVEAVKGSGMDTQRFILKICEEDFNKIWNLFNELNKYKFLVDTLQKDFESAIKDIILKQKGD